ncbi:hypothetical protein HPB49_013507 [Dermacentor silvarum]|uniref:Uncharacterized protein n=1 Tax=Dermacentor silvarum TaxID=543639 RepID=A0ACB8C9M8_DERSI|nr:hypothetical protein HPB49_013507 [Dermacentor silvarum]
MKTRAGSVKRAQAGEEDKTEFVSCHQAELPGLGFRAEPTEQSIYPRPVFLGELGKQVGLSLCLHRPYALLCEHPMPTCPDAAEPPERSSILWWADVPTQLSGNWLVVCRASTPAPIPCANLCYRFIVAAPRAVSACQEDDDGMGFALPDLHFLNGVVKENIPLTSYITTRIVDSLFQEMTAHTMYPSHKFYQGTASTVVRRYPELADPCGSGHAQGLVSSGEDSCSLAQHEALLVSESKKANPDRPQMLWRLQLTHTARAKDLCQMSPVEAMEKYPYLADKEWDEDKPCTRCIVCTGTTLEAADELFLFAEKKQLARVIDAEEGTTAMMAAY